MKSPDLRNLSLEFRRSFTAALVAAFFVTLIATRPAHAQTETVLYQFCALAHCADGQDAQGNVILDSSGNLYGTGLYGGANDGVVYKVAADGSETVLYTWGPDTNLGSYPRGGVIRDGSGNFYGTTTEGGAYGSGTVYKLSPAGKLTVLYNFGASSTDGNDPVAGLVRDSLGNLYGTTYQGGANGYGTIFKISPAGEETILYNFASTSTDGFYPEAGLVMDKSGNLYGTTAYGGVHDKGTVFEVTATGSYSTLYSFGAGKTDGSLPAAGLTLDAKGLLYGTTSYGGANNDGTIFRLSPTANGKWKETILYSYVAGNGYLPLAGVTLDKKGNIYATAAAGGSGGSGTVFELSPTGTVTVLCNFDGIGNGGDPQSNVVLDSAGNLYGSTIAGGAAGLGVVYKITP